MADTVRCNFCESTFSEQKIIVDKENIEHCPICNTEGCLMDIEESEATKTTQTTETKPIKKVCNHCGSENVRINADCAWSVIEQKWEVVNIFDSTTCEDCGCERHIEDVEI